MMSLLSILPRSSLQPSLFSPLPPGKIHRFPCLKLHRPFPRLLLLRAVRSLPSYDEDLFRSFTSPSQGGDEGPTLLPGVRSYENDLARLTVVGAIGYDLAMTAAAADGGHAARQHLSSGSQTMVVETLFPGSLDEHSTISTKLVELANILDMFYEDRFTLPQKQLSCSCIERLTPTSQSKSSKWQMILLPVAWGFLLVSFGILSRVFAPHLVMARKAFELPKPALISDSNFCQIQSLGIVELEPLCNSVVERIKDSLGFSGNILFDPIIGAWTGQLPAYFKRESDAGIYEESVTSNGETNSTPSSNLVDETGLSDCCKPLSGEDSQVQFGLAQDIASYQVVFTNAGQIIGFQPTNRVAVNYWAGNRFAKLLYCGKKLSPGLLEPGLKVPHPDKVILIELLLSVNPKSWFALARPFKT